MAEAYEVYDWDSEIENDSEGFTLLEPGIYNFEVLKLEKEFYEGGKNAPACPRAKITIRCVGSDGSSAVVSDSFLLYSGMEWKISAFFRSIGYKQHGQKVAMKWDAEWLKGQKGTCKIKNREFTFTRGEKAGEKGMSNEVDAYLDPTDDVSGDDGDGW